MSLEILNIDFHIQRMVLKALNTCENLVSAAEKLGITERGLYNYKKKYCIEKVDKYYIIK